MTNVDVLYRARDLKGNWVEGQLIDKLSYEVITEKIGANIIYTGLELIPIDISTVVMFTGVVDASESHKKIWEGSKVLFAFMRNTEPIEPGIVKWDKEILQWIIVPDDSNTWGGFENPSLGKLVSWLRVLVIE